MADVLADAEAERPKPARGPDLRTEATGRPGLGRLLGTGAILAVVGGLAALVAGLDAAQAAGLGLVVGLVRPGGRLAHGDAGRAWSVPRP